MPKRSFDELVQLMQTLRGPNGCPWDRKQTLPSLKPFVIEESYEVVDAIDRDDRASLAEELGDFLLQAVFIAELTREEGSFDIYDAITAIHDKLVRRHPHVFGDLLFTIANIARKLNVNAEEALQSTNRKFSRRFESMESRVRETGRNVDQLTLEEMDALWDEAKAAERG